MSVNRQFPDMRDYITTTLDYSTPETYADSIAFSQAFGMRPFDYRSINPQIIAEQQRNLYGAASFPTQAIDRMIPPPALALYINSVNWNPAAPIGYNFYYTNPYYGIQSTARGYNMQPAPQNLGDLLWGY